MSPPDALARLRLARTQGVGPLLYHRLMARFGSAEAALAAWPDIARGRRTAAPCPESRAVREMEGLARLGGRFLFFGEPAYPPALAALPDAPPLLAVLGDPSLLCRPAVAVVGARSASLNGRTLARDLARDLAGRGLIVVSGLARGVDRAAHEGALESGATVAAIAGGLDRPYPPEHAALQAEIAAHGAVVSEAPLGTAPIAQHFPRRNRIIAGLSLGVVVVEAALKSGSLITARMALEAGREIFAVPGSPRDPRCRGSNDLIRQGAHLTEGIDDVLDHLPPAFAAPAAEERGSRRKPRRPHAPTPFLSPGAPAPASPAPAEPLLSLLGAAPVEIDLLARETARPLAEIMADLLELELAGRVVFLPGNRVALIEGRG
jgi:DNA processing protein